MSTRRQKIGEERICIVTADAGFFPCVGSDNEVIEVLEATQLARVDRFGYEHPITKAGLGWHTLGWRELNDAERAKQELARLEEERAAKDALDEEVEAYQAAHRERQQAFEDRQREWAARWERRWFVRLWRWVRRRREPLPQARLLDGDGK